MKISSQFIEETLKKTRKQENHFPAEQVPESFIGQVPEAQAGEAGWLSAFEGAFFL